MLAAATCASICGLPNISHGLPQLPKLYRVQVIPDQYGPSILITLRAARLQPLIIVSHRLGGDAFGELETICFERVLDPLAENGFALLLSSDGGEETYGNDKALAYNRRVLARATAAFNWDHQLFSLGVSMGGLPALLGAYREIFPEPVRAVATIAGVTNLSAVRAAPSDRQARIDTAYGATSSRDFAMRSRGHDPLRDLLEFPGRMTPVLAIGSRRDEAVPSAEHAEKLVAAARAMGAQSEFLEVPGEHIDPSHFTSKVADRIQKFFERAASI